MSLTITKLENGKVRFDEVGGLQRNYDANYDVAESPRADYIVILAPEGNRLEEFIFSDVTQLVDAEGGTINSPDLATLLEELSTNYFDGSGVGGSGSSVADTNKKEFFTTTSIDVLNSGDTDLETYKPILSETYEVKKIVPHMVTISGWLNNSTGRHVCLGFDIGGKVLDLDLNDELTVDGSSTVDGATTGSISAAEAQRLIYKELKPADQNADPAGYETVSPVYIRARFTPDSLGSKAVALDYLLRDANDPATIGTFNVTIEEVSESGGTVVSGVTATGNGFIDYNDTTGGVSLTANTWTDIPNDGAGAFTNKNYPATGVTELMDVATGYIDCTELELGDSILVRNDFTVNPSTNNALLELRYELGNGGGIYTLETIMGRLDSGSGQDYRFSLKPDLIYMGDTNTRDNPIKIQVRCSSNATLTNAGSVIQVIKR